MANKIFIDFSTNPSTGLGFTYFCMQNGYKLSYARVDVTDVKINFLAFGASEVDFFDVAIESTLTLTIDKVLQRLKDNYINEKVSYSRINNTIQVFINTDCEVTLIETHPNIIATFQEVPIIFPDLKYYIQFEDYFLGIRQKNYQGFATEVFGNVVLKKGNVDDVLDTIRGTGLNIDLEANPNLTFDEFLLADEMTYTVQLKKGNQTIFKGFIKPDGVQQSYVSDIWFINIEAIDGLGALKDLSFVYPDGSQFIGKLSMFDIIKACLDRTGSLMTVNSSVDLEYIGYSGANILKDTYINSSRFLKNDGSTIMDCNSVLNSVLNLLSAVITQQDGQWWIYRPNDLKLNNPALFIDNTTDTTFSVNLNKILGSQIDGFYPHHCNTNQQIEVKGAISAYRLNYEYGYPLGLLQNGKLNHDTNLNFTGWTVDITNSSYLINNSLSNSGMLVSPDNSIAPLKKILTSDKLFLEAPLSFKVSGTVKANGIALFYFMVKVGNQYLKADGTWTSLQSFFLGAKIYATENESLGFFTKSFELETDIIPFSGDAQIIIYIPKVGFNPDAANVCEVSSINLSNPNAKDGKVGEFHTVSRKLPPSSITKENQTVFNGDGTNSLIGSIYKSDKIELTTLWKRKGKFEQYPLLRISAEDDLRIKRNAIKVFSGDVLGYLPYLSIISINNILGLFMFTEYSYDFRSKVLNAKLTQFYNDELGDVDYLLSYDYGNNKITPTIKG